MKRHGVAVCLWRQIVAFGILVFLTSGGVSQAVESQAVQAESDDPEAMKEAEGWLRLDMRQDGADFFIYPSFHDAGQHTKMVQYRAIEKQPGIIDDVMVEVLDPDGNVDWSSENLGTAADWKDSDFEGRTNYTRAANNSQDAGGQPNKVEDLFKFVDPGGSGQATFTARLTVTLTTAERLIATYPFQVRRRVVAVVEQTTGFGCGGKPWIWKVYGRQVGGAPVCTNPSQNDDELLLDYNTYNFDQAYECLTPRGTLYSVNHGFPSGNINLGKHSIGGWEMSLFSGFRWGDGEAELLDVSPFAHAHQTIIELLHCYSAIDGGGAAKSLADTLSTKVGQGGQVLGYPALLKLGTSATFDAGTAENFNPPEAKPTGTKWDDFVKCVKDAITAELQRDTEQRHNVFDGNGSIAWTWVRDHTVQNIVSDVSFDEGWIIAEALTAYRALYEDDPTFTFTLSGLQFLYDVNNAYNNQLGERQSFPK